MAGNVGPILVGTDFSETSAVALGAARRLADMLGAPLEVLHVVDGGGSWMGDGAESWLSAAGLSTELLIVRFGSPWVELARYAAEVSPTLVVVGSHGASGYQPLTIGSTASRVTVQARCPVVLVSPRVAAAGVDGSMQDRRTGNAGRADAAGRVPGRSGKGIQPTGETR